MTKYYLRGEDKNWYWMPEPASPEKDGKFWKSVTLNHEFQWKDVKDDEYFAPRGKIFRYLFVGVGSSIAYYLNAMGNDFDHSLTCIIGESDAWTQEVRGDGFINHEEHQVSQWGKTVPKFSNKYMERSVFAAQNKSIFDRAEAKGAKRLSTTVKAVTLRGHVVEVSCAKGETLLAARAVVGAGAGPHYSFEEGRGPVLNGKFKSPPEWADQKSKLKGKVINLDEFMQFHPRTPKMLSDPLRHEDEREEVVIVHGPNAGIDAVHRAWQYGYKVLWLSGNTDPVLLPGNRLGLSEAMKTDRIEFQKIGRESPQVEEEEGEVRVTYTYNSAPQSVLVRYYVIALGQNPFAEGAIGDILKKGGTEMSALEPIYDVNQIFGLPYQTVLGFQSKGSCHGRGLQIIGAAADSLARAPNVGIKHNYTEQFGLVTAKDPGRVAQRNAALRYLASMPRMADLMDHQVDPVKVPGDLNPKSDSLNLISTKDSPAATTVASVLLNAQLGGVRAAAAALVGFIPEYSKRDANMTTDDRTMLTVHIASKYPYIPPGEVEAEVAKIIQERRSAERPLGYSDVESDEIKRRLSKLNAEHRLMKKSKEAA